MSLDFQSVELVHFFRPGKVCKIFELYEKVISLNLSYNEISESWYRSFADQLKGPYPNLRHLILSRTSNDRSQMAGLEYFLTQVFERDLFPNLETLNLHLNVTDNGLETVADAMKKGKCLQLKILILSDAKLGAESITKFFDALNHAKPTQMSELILEECGLSDGHVEALARALKNGACPNLIKLNLEGNEIHEKCLRALAKAFNKNACVNLRYFKLSHDEMSNHSMTELVNALTRCPNLTFLELHADNYPRFEHHNIHPDLIHALENLFNSIPNIQNLELIGFDMNDEACMKLTDAMLQGKLTNVQKIVLYRNELQWESVLRVCAASPMCPHFNHLNVQYNNPLQNNKQKFRDLINSFESEDGYKLQVHT